MSEDLTTTQSEGGNKVSAFIRREIGRVAALASLVIIFAFFTIMRPVFASWANVSGGILMSTTVIGLLAIGVTFVIITGGIDLSVGTSMALVAVITGKTVMAYDLSVWSGILLGMVVGALLGAINGLLITVLKDTVSCLSKRLPANISLPTITPTVVRTSKMCCAKARK